MVMMTEKEEEEEHLLLLRLLLLLYQQTAIYNALQRRDVESGILLVILNTYLKIVMQTLTTIGAVTILRVRTK